jgi:hypothetical protein
MSKDQNDSPLPRLQQPRYGVDAPAFPAVLGAVGTACFLAARRWRPGRTAMATAGTVLLANTGIYLHTTLHGKLRIWRREHRLPCGAARPRRKAVTALLSPVVVAAL